MFKNIVYLCALLVAFLFLFLPGYTKVQELRDRNSDLVAKIKRLNIENALLQQELKKIEDDTFYQEKIIREKMGVVRKNEIPVKVVPEIKD